METKIKIETLEKRFNFCMGTLVDKGTTSSEWLKGNLKLFIEFETSDERDIDVGRGHRTIYGNFLSSEIKFFFQLIEFDEEGDEVDWHEREPIVIYNDSNYESLQEDGPRYSDFPRTI